MAEGLGVRAWLGSGVASLSPSGWFPAPSSSSAERWQRRGTRLAAEFILELRLHVGNFAEVVFNPATYGLSGRAWQFLFMEV
jgi:hypothetical protein